MVTVGWFANWIRVDVTYVMSGFLPMKISLLGLPCLTVLVFEDMSAILIRRLAYNVYYAYF